MRNVLRPSRGTAIIEVRYDDERVDLMEAAGAAVRAFTDGIREGVFIGTASARAGWLAPEEERCRCRRRPVADRGAPRGVQSYDGGMPRESESVERDINVSASDFEALATAVDRPARSRNGLVELLQRPTVFVD